jgi:hypothetical protein
MLNLIKLNFVIYILHIINLIKLCIYTWVVYSSNQHSWLAQAVYSLLFLECYVGSSLLPYKLLHFVLRAVPVLCAVPCHMAVPTGHKLEPNTTPSLRVGPAWPIYNHLCRAGPTFNHVGPCRPMCGMTQLPALRFMNHTSCCHIVLKTRVTCIRHYYHREGSAYGYQIGYEF